MKKNLLTAILIILILTAIAALIVFDLVHITYTGDETLNSLINAVIPRLIAGGALLAVLVYSGCKKILIPDFKSLPKYLLWCIPCFLVVLANFPFTALIGGSAKILRSELIPLFILECLSIGIMEEFLFRGILQDTVNGLFKNKPHRRIFTVAVTSSIFALTHLFNLFAGAGVGATFLQIGYCFLIGAMLSAVLIKTNDIWLCVILHAAFDFGGNIVTELGTGAFQDLCFWIFTAVAGSVCFAYILFFLIKDDRASDKNQPEII